MNNFDVAGRTLRVGTRGSALATAQTGQVVAALQKLWPGLQVEMITITTKGDVTLEVPLHEVGGKGLFVKEIEEALLAGTIDLAVHSCKDMPADLPPGLALCAYPKRADVRDALISRAGLTLDQLPHGACVGTSSLRRVFQLRHLRPDLRIEPLRGNVDTRLRKLREGRYDAVLLAAAGLGRLGLAGEITEHLDPLRFIPAVAQGALALEARVGDDWVWGIAAAVNDADTATAVTAERAFLDRIQGGCQVPAGAYARLEDGRLAIDGFLADPEGTFYVQDSVSGAPDEAAELGRELAGRLLASGGAKIVEGRGAAQ